MVYMIVLFILAENSHLTYDLLSQDIYDYLDASLMVTANPIEDVKKIETIPNNHLKNLRRLINAVAEANSTENEQLISITKTQIFLKLLPAFCQREQQREYTRRSSHCVSKFMRCFNYD